jgi:hypothetical protein
VSTLPGNPHAVNADSTASTRDAYIQAQATLALAHEIRTLTLATLEATAAAHGYDPADPGVALIFGRLGA